MSDPKQTGTLFILSAATAIIGGFCWHWQIGMALLSLTLLLLAIGSALTK